MEESTLEHPACAGADPRLFDWDPNPSRQPRTMLQLFTEARAKAYCNRCPDAAECLRIGLTSGNLEFVIRGGMNPAERQAVEHEKVKARRRIADRERAQRNRVSA